MTAIYRDARNMINEVGSNMISFDRTLPVSPYANVSKVLTHLSCLLAFFFPVNRLYLLDDPVSVQTGVVSVIIGMAFVFTAWWNGRLWERYRTIKYLSMQVVTLVFLIFLILTQIISIPRQWHGPIVTGYLVLFWFLAVQRGESRNGRSGSTHTEAKNKNHWNHN